LGSSSVLPGGEVDTEEEGFVDCASFSSDGGGGADERHVHFGDAEVCDKKALPSPRQTPSVLASVSINTA
jgi:hypothetical protein